MGLVVSLFVFPLPIFVRSAAGGGGLEKIGWINVSRVGGARVWQSLSLELSIAHGTLA